MTFGDQFGRSFDLRIGDRIIQSQAARDPGKILRVDFSVTQTNAKDPNTCKISIYNTARDTQDELSKRRNGLILSAGYGDDSKELFRGAVDIANTVIRRPDIITMVEASDSRFELRAGRIQKSYSPGTTLRTVMLDALAAAAINKGNVEQAINEKARKGVDGTFTFTQGYMASGRASDVVSKLAKMAGLSWSVQGGEFVGLTETSTRDSATVLVSPDSGLIGSPEVAERIETIERTGKKKRRRYFKFRSLLQGRIRPGVAVQLDSDRISSFIRADKVTHSGSTFGQNWYTDVEGRQV